MPGRVTVRGAGRLRRFSQRFGDPDVTQQALARAMAAVLRRYLVPALRRELPRRTGAIRRTLRIQERRGGVSIRIAFYWKFLRIGSPPRRVDVWVMDWVESNRTVLREALRTEVRRALVGGLG